MSDEPTFTGKLANVGTSPKVLELLERIAVSNEQIAALMKTLSAQIQGLVVSQQDRGGLHRR